MLPNAPRAFDFGLGEAADMLRESVSRFAADRIAPLADRIDREDWFPRELWPEMGALGLHGITVAEEDGGAGLGYLEHCVAMEEVSRASGSVGLSYGAHSNLCVNQISRWGTAGAEGALSAEAHVWRASRRARDVGSGCRLRRGVDAASRRSARRQLHPERHEILDHQRAAGRHARRLCQDRSFGRRARHHRLHRREGVSRVSPSRKNSTSSACAARRPASWCSRTARCRRRMCLARSGRA